MCDNKSITQKWWNYATLPQATSTSFFLTTQNKGLITVDPLGLP